ncbi:hypothetical protein [Thalassomonas actiniarum]|uniref:Secreted protein n=1 Tax=Thalassomonas actiniarum TaxID=485447 RepID=A0AAE9YRK0_9GAMM|nr:hypothetical protein [Thalassomonas actiniarum]WDD99934.1 hypothetical protein SG35_004540 [Thalassomonas actiniarum]
MKSSVMLAMAAAGMMLAGAVTSAPANAKDPNSVVYHVACYDSFNGSFLWYELADYYVEARQYAVNCTSQGGKYEITTLL